MIVREDLETFSKIGKALWVEPSIYKRAAVETLSAVSLLNLTPERTLEKASTALLQRAKSKGSASNSQLNLQVLSQRFFRLTAEDRFVLVALHAGKWSYERLSRILGRNVDEVQELSWSARIQIGMSSVYPAGPSPMGVNCPEYHSRRPWTQRYLDGEISSGGDRHFLQTHLMFCPGCKKALTRCREIYSKVDQEIARVVGEEDLAEFLEQIIEESPSFRRSSEKSFLETLWIFLHRWDVSFMSLLLVAVLLLRIFR